MEVFPDDTMHHLASHAVAATGVSAACLELRLAGRTLSTESATSGNPKRICDTAIVSGDFIDVACGTAAIIHRLKSHEIRLVDCPLWAKSHQNVVQTALKIEGGAALRDAAPEMQDSDTVVQLAVSLDATALCCASERLRDDRDLVLKAVAESWHVFPMVSERCRGDKEIVLAAVGKNGVLLRYASSALRGDRDVVLKAVKQNPDASEHALGLDNEGTAEVNTFVVAHEAKTAACPWLCASDGVVTNEDIISASDISTEADSSLAEWVLEE